MQHFFKDYTSVPYVDTVTIKEENVIHFNTFSSPAERAGRNIGNNTYGVLDSDLDAIELAL